MEEGVEEVSESIWLSVSASADMVAVSCCLEQSAAGRLGREIRVLLGVTLSEGMSEISCLRR